MSTRTSYQECLEFVFISSLQPCSERLDVVTKWALHFLFVMAVVAGPQRLINMKKILIYMFSLTMLVGCAGFHELQTTQTVSINQGNFRMIRPVQAEESSVYIFGIGGLGWNAQTVNAVDKLIYETNLEPNEAIAYISTRKNTAFYVGGIVTRVNTVASGWVVAFADADGNLPEAPSKMEQPFVQSKNMFKLIDNGNTRKNYQTFLQAVEHMEPTQANYDKISSYAEETGLVNARGYSRSVASTLRKLQSKINK